MVKTRFAPSPTGHLHLGHAYAALVAARLGDGYLLRIDDIDHTRCRPAFTDQIFDDLQWLGLQWHGPVIYQSQRLDAYDAALATLRAADLVYPCYLSRAELGDFLSAPHANTASAPAPRTYNALSQQETDQRIAAGMQPAWRLHADKAIDYLAAAGTKPQWLDAASGNHIDASLTAFGDVVLGRKDIGTSYHLSVVIDDAMDRVSLVTRGDDLRDSTHVHAILQALLDLPSPAYLHHPLVNDAAGNRLAKRDDARSIVSLREDGISAQEIIDSLPDIPALPISH